MCFLDETGALMGAVAYDYKLTGGLISMPSAVKVGVLGEVRRLVGVTTLAGPVRTARFRVNELR
jgi:hypothetical protein